MNRVQITLLLSAIALIGAGLTIPSSGAFTPNKSLTKTIQVQLPDLPETLPKSITEEDSHVQLDWKKFKVKKGDSMALIFRRAGEKATTLHKIMSSGKPADGFKHLRVGQIVEFGYSTNKQLQSVRVTPNKTQQLIALQLEKSRLPFPAISQQHLYNYPYHVRAMLVPAFL